MTANVMVMRFAHRSATAAFTEAQELIYGKKKLGDDEDLLLLMGTSGRPETVVLISKRASPRVSIAESTGNSR